MKVLFFPGSLETGGAQAQAALLARGLAGRGHEVRLLTLFPGGKFWDQLTAAGGPVPQALFERRSGRLKTLRALAAAPAELRRRAGASPPDVVLSSLYLSNLLAARAWPGPRPPLVWSVRGSDVPWTTIRRLYFEAGRSLAGRPRAVIYNSSAGRDWHLRRGFPSRGSRVIVNGIDTAVYFRDRTRGLPLREAWGVGSEEELVGLAGRLSPMKDHPTFLEAASQVLRRRPSARFVLIGGGTKRLERQLRAQVHRLGLGDRLVWAGEVRRMSDAYNALDLLVSSSAYGEGFSNALAEGMASELSIVATDCGDARKVLGDTGRVVACRRPTRLAEAMVEALEEGMEVRQERGRAARSRVVEHFSVEQMVSRTEALLEEVAASGGET
ncbi:MAG: glycosyltransferase [Acidobacteria bacterium]|nr:glycosyltransferase [Acidobacteriota bacterium]